MMGYYFSFLDHHFCYLVVVALYRNNYCAQLPDPVNDKACQLPGTRWDSTPVSKSENKISAE